MKQIRSYAEINEKIKNGRAVVLTAEEFIKLSKKEGLKSAAKKVDIVTTATFGPMCSSGIILNFGHSDPPIKMQSVWLNDVPTHAGLAAVDIYLGATEISTTKGMEYGGAHVIEDLIRRNKVTLKAVAYGTDCYPRKDIKTKFTLDSINQAIMLNPRNAYQNYSVAVNSSNRTLYTYMGVLLPNLGNATYCNASQLSPMIKDPLYRTIGVGTRIFFGGAVGYVAWEGTQHNPTNERDPNTKIPYTPSGTLCLIGDLKNMSTDFIRAALFHKYGTTLYVGVGIPIPVLDEDMARHLAVTDDKIFATIIDYSVPKRAKPKLGRVSYAELRSGYIEIEGKKVPTAPLSSYAKAREISSILKKWIESGKFPITQPLERLSLESTFKPLDVME